MWRSTEDMVMSRTTWRWTFGCAAASCVLLAHMAACDAAGEAKGPELPSAAARAVAAAFPKAKVAEVEVENEDGVKLYEVELEQGGKELEVKVSPTGTIVEVESEIALGDVPKAVAAAIAKAAGGGKVVEVEKVEARAVQKSGQWVKLDTPVTHYEAEFRRDGKTHEIRLTAAGTVVKIEEEDDDDDD